MSKKTDIIIIGAGPAGLMAANHIKKDTIILENNKRAGIKLLISGAGQCNYTNNIPIKEFFTKYGDHKRFVQYGLSKFTNKDSIDFFNRKGVESSVREDQKVFPASFKAKSILEALLKDLEHSIIYNTKVQNIQKKNNGFSVKTTTGVYEANKIIVATGGCTYPRTGSTGDGYELAKQLNIPVTEINNGLCSIRINRDLSTLSGITLKNTTASIYRDHKKEKEINGDLLITHNGLSGPLIINNARDLRKKDLLKINFIGENEQVFDEKLQKISQEYSKKDIINALKVLNLPNRLLAFLTKDIDAHKNIASLTKEERKILINNFVKNTFEVKAVGNSSNSMVTVGGVDLNAINKKTMATNKNTNVYFIGEVLDVDGDTGGFNIQWAFSSGYLASIDINNK
jgi:hypothetical protein